MPAIRDRIAQKEASLNMSCEDCRYMKNGYCEWLGAAISDILDVCEKFRPRNPEREKALIDEGHENR